MPAGQMMAAGAAALGGFVWNCGKSALQGAYNDMRSTATGGKSSVVSTLKCLWSPVACATTVVTGVQNFVSFIGDLGKNLSALYSGISIEEVGKIACSFIGSLGPGILMSFFLGLGAAKLMAKLASIIMNLKVLAGLMKFLKDVGMTISQVVDLGKDELEKLTAIFQAGKFNELKQAGFNPNACAVN